MENTETPKKPLLAGLVPTSKALEHAETVLGRMQEDSEALSSLLLDLLEQLEDPREYQDYPYTIRFEKALWVFFENSGDFYFSMLVDCLQYVEDEDEWFLTDAASFDKQDAAGLDYSELVIPGDLRFESAARVYGALLKALS